MAYSSSDQMKWLRSMIGGVVYDESTTIASVARKVGGGYGTVYRVANKQVGRVQLATYTQLANGLEREFPLTARRIGRAPGPFFEGYGA